MKKDSKWEKVSFAGGKTQAPVCELTFRPNGQIVFSAATMEGLSYPQYVTLFINEQETQIAIKGATKADEDTLLLCATEPARDQPRTIMAKKVFRWLCGMVSKGEEDMLIKLSGEPSDEGMIVFDLKKAVLKPKRVRKAAPAE